VFDAHSDDAALPSNRKGVSSTQRQAIGRSKQTDTLRSTRPVERATEKVPAPKESVREREIQHKLERSTILHWFAGNEGGDGQEGAFDPDGTESRVENLSHLC